MNRYFSSTRDGLLKECSDCFSHALGASSSDFELEDFSELHAILTPHGAACDGFVVQSHAIKALSLALQQKSQRKVTFVVLGTDHRMRPTYASLKNWVTPLGVVQNERELTTAIAEVGSIPIEEGMAEEEHSLENQLPLLQYLAMEMKETSGSPLEWSIVPITVGRSKDGALS